MWNNRKVSRICCLVLALLQMATPSSALNTGVYLQRPVDVTVANGKSVEFLCGVPEVSPQLTLTFYGSKGTYNLTCPNGYVEAIPKTLYGKCDMKNGQSVATWRLSEASMSDSGTRVVCQQPNSPDAPSAVLNVYHLSNNHTVLISCTLGGFFVTLLVFGLLYLLLQKSEAFRQCFRGKDTEDDLSTIVTD